MRRTARSVVGRVTDRFLVPGAPPRTHQYRVEPDLAVPMRDGVTLLGDRVVPFGAADDAPTVLIRTPYGRRGLAAATSAYPIAARGLPVFIQSCRGTFGSEGSFEPVTNERDDGIDTVTWLRDQPWFTGRLATFGPSYLGITQWALAGPLSAEKPELAPDVLCAHVTAPDVNQMVWDHGVFLVELALSWAQLMDVQERPLALMRSLVDRRALRRGLDRIPLSDGDRAAVGTTVAWYQDWLGHERLDDPFWNGTTPGDTIEAITAAVVMVTGWYDVFLPWQIDSYQRLWAAGNPPRLVIGPWGHPSPAAAGRGLAESVAIIGYRLMDGQVPHQAPVEIYVTGAEEWRDLSEWPPPSEPVDLLLQPFGALSTGLAPAGGPTRYVYDPYNPTPAVGGPALDRASTPVDNRELEARADVLVFTGPPLSEPVDVIGTPEAVVHLRTDRPSTDVFVRICDVHPDGTSMNVCDGIRRIGSSGTRGVDPVPDAGGVVAVELPLWPTAHRFGTGHRIRVQVCSGAHPRYARNLGSAEPAATATHGAPAHQEVFHDPGHRSGVRLPVVAGSTDPASPGS
ncbi:MAG: CocE/NonD family hydrolase [Acidimicrobiales bacterium]